MGLDGVELVMECEKTFGISIPDEDASNTRTMGDLLALIKKLIAYRLARGACPSASVFRRLRRGLMQIGVAKNEIRPSSVIDQIVPLCDRRSNWQMVARSAQLRLPNLGNSQGAVFIALSIPMVVGGTVFVMKKNTAGMCLASLA